MSFTYDTTTDRGKVRLMCGDTSSDNQIFSDAEIDAFLSLNDSDLRYSAAQALEAIAANQVYVLKVTQLLDLRVDGAAVARELRQQAKSLRDQSDADASFDVAEMVVTPFNARERVWNEYLREVA